MRGVMRRLRSEEGVTLVELLVVVLITTVVMGVALGAVVTGLESQRSQSARLDALDDARRSLERVVRDIRAADPLLVAELDHIGLEAFREGEQRVVHWELQGTSLVNELEVTDVDTGVTSTASRTEVPEVADPGEAIFTYLDSDGEELEEPVNTDLVRSVQVQLRLPAQDGSVFVEDQVSVRNAGRQ